MKIKIEATPQELAELMNLLRTDSGETDAPAYISDDSDDDGSVDPESPLGKVLAGKGV